MDPGNDHFSQERLCRFSVWNSNLKSMTLPLKCLSRKISGLYV